MRPGKGEGIKSGDTPFWDSFFRPFLDVLKYGNLPWDIFNFSDFVLFCELLKYFAVNFWISFGLLYCEGLPVSFIIKCYHGKISSLLNLFIRGFSG